MARLSVQGRHAAHTKWMGNPCNIFFGKRIGKTRLGELIVDVKSMLTDLKEMV